MVGSALANSPLRTPLSAECPRLSTTPSLLPASCIMRGSDSALSPERIICARDFFEYV
jgi:hypothetical protein